MSLDRRSFLSMLPTLPAWALACKSETVPAHLALDERDPLSFVYSLSDGNIERPRHFRYLSGLVGGAIRRGNARIIVCLPPRHGASTFFGEYLLPWFLEQWPERRVLYAANSYSQASTVTGLCRLALRANEDRLQTRVAGESVEPEWHTVTGGACYPAGLSTAVTGRAVDLLVFDSRPLSRYCQDEVADGYDRLSLRLVPGGSAVVVTNRSPRHDLTDHLIDKGLRLSAERWTLVRLPAIYDRVSRVWSGTCSLGRNDGEPLWPERCPATHLQRIKATLCREDWVTQYQQL